MKRKAFLEAFLGSFGRVVTITSVTDGYIRGIVTDNPNDPEEQQEFCWHATEATAPSSYASQLAQLIKDESLLDIDRISVPREALRRMYNRRWSVDIPLTQFNEIIEELLRVRVPMLDKGQETDAYLVHE